jgi:hypothetical protein
VDEVLDPQPGRPGFRRRSFYSLAFGALERPFNRTRRQTRGTSTLSNSGGVLSADEFHGVPLAALDNRVLPDDEPVEDRER